MTSPRPDRHGLNTAATGHANSRLRALGHGRIVLGIHAVTSPVPILLEELAAHNGDSPDRRS